MLPILKFKEFTLYNIIARKTTFSVFWCFENWFICWNALHKKWSFPLRISPVNVKSTPVKFIKVLFKLDGLLQSINLCLANVLSKVFEVWTFPHISLTFGSRSELLLELHEDANGKQLSLFYNFLLLTCSWEIARAF